MEHTLIRQYLGHLADAVDKMEGGQRLPGAFLESAVDFAREFVDEYHHFKEEHQMFFLVARKNNGSVDVPIATLLDQHERSMKHLERIAAALPGYQERDSAREAMLQRNLTAYVALMRDHIQQEDNVFLAFAESELSASELEQLAAEFQRADARMVPGYLEKSRAWVVELGDLLG